MDPVIQNFVKINLANFRINKSKLDLMYRQTSNISRTKTQNLIVPCLVLQLSLSNPMKPGLKSRMKM